MRYVKVLTVFLSIVFFQIILTTDSNATTCTKSSGIFDISDIPNNGEGCEDQPNLYEVILYEGWLCTSASAASTFPSTSSVADLSNCFKIFENINGASLSIAQLQAINIDGAKFKPPSGSYTHGYLRLDNSFGLTWSGQMSGSMTGSQGSGAGIFCGTHTNDVTFNSSTQTTNTSICDSSEVTAGKLVESLATFDCCGTYNSLSDEVTVTGSSDKIQGVITDANQFRSTSDSDASRLEALLTFSNPIEITEETRSITVKFNLTNGMQLEQRSNKLEIGGGPFFMLLQTE